MKEFDMFRVQEVDDITYDFPADVRRLMPEYSDIPAEFKHGDTKWNKFFANWFFRGVKITKITPKEGVDGDKAMRHIGAIMGSYQPRYEHKEAAVAYLCSQWFEDIEWEEVRSNEKV
jgi:hypothetical protein